MLCLFFSLFTLLLHAQLVDDKASALTVSLYKKLKQISASDSVMFGHQNTNWRGQYWTDDKGKMDTSDMLVAVNDWPAVFIYMPGHEVAVNAVFVPLVSSITAEDLPDGENNKYCKYHNLFIGE